MHAATPVAAQQLNQLQHHEFTTQLTSSRHMTLPCLDVAPAAEADREARMVQAEEEATVGGEHSSAAPSAASS